MTFSIEVEPLVETVPLTTAVVLASLPLLSAGALVSVESLPPPHPARVKARTADAAKMLRADFAFLFMIDSSFLWVCFCLLLSTVFSVVGQG